MPSNSANMMDHVCNPRNVGRIKDPDAAGRSGKGRPPFMTMHFRLNDGLVTDVKYQTFGCGPAIAAGSVLTEMIKNRSIAECLAITEQQLTDTLGGLPSDKTWCVRLALATMRDALAKHDGKEA